MDELEKEKNEFISEIKGSFATKEELEGVKKEFEAFKAAQKSLPLPNVESKEVIGFSKWIKKQMTEGTGATGGYLVPPEYTNRILDVTANNSFVLQRADVFPVSSNVDYIPYLNSDVSFTWTAENVEGTETKPQFGQLGITIKKAMGIIYIPNELLDDANIGPELDGYLSLILGRAMGKEIDRVALVGNASGGDPFNGIINTSGVNVVRTASTTGIDYGALVDTIFSISDDKAVDPVWIAHRLFYAQCFKLEDTEGHLVLTPEAKTLLGYPYLRSERMPYTFTANQPIAIFGDLKNVRIAMRRDLTIDLSRDVKFTYDQTVLRAKFRLGIGIYDPAAFTVLKTKSS